MRYLLDTHAVLWFITDDPRLPEKLREEIRNVNNSCLVSIASLWEIAIKHSLKKLNLKRSLDEIVDIINQSNLPILSIEQSHVIKLDSLAYHHRDPFDRLLIAQAAVEDLTILTRDQAFAAYGVPLQWN